MTQNAEISMIFSNYFSGEITAKQQETLRMVENYWEKWGFQRLGKANYLYTTEPNFRIKKLPKRSNVFARKIMRYATLLLVIIAVGIYWKISSNKMSMPSFEFISVAVTGEYQVFEMQKKIVFWPISIKYSK